MTNDRLPFGRRFFFTFPVTQNTTFEVSPQNPYNQKYNFILIDKKT